VALLISLRQLNQRFILSMSIMFLLLMSLPSLASQTIYESKCISCHGVYGEGNEALKSPSIAGLSERYIARQLNHFKNGIRGNHEQDTSGRMMAAIAVPLTDAQIVSVSQYLAQLPFQAVPPGEKSAGFIGAGLFRQCQSCHGAKGQGEESLFAPRIAGQHLWYLTKQIENFKSGIRGMHDEDKLGRQMVDIAKPLDNEHIELILIHLSKLKPSGVSHESHH